MKKKILVEGRELNLMTETATLRREQVLTESEGSESKSKWVADIWKLGEENLNHRIYPVELGERLVKEQPVTTVNDGHFRDWTTGMEYECAKAVTKNLRIENNLLKADIEFLESEKDYEKRLEELYQKGVAIGVSSVGYGEYLGDGKTIDPESYTVVRLMDFVTTPAGQVYASMEQDDSDDNQDDDKDEELSSHADEKKSETSEKKVKAISEIINRRK